MNPGSAPHTRLARVHITPAPAEVARLVESDGPDAANERWYWLDPRTIGYLAQKGRKRL